MNKAEELINLVDEMFAKKSTSFEFEGKHAIYEEIIDGIRTMFFLIMTKTKMSTIIKL